MAETGYTSIYSSDGSKREELNVSKSNPYAPLSRPQ
jgi:hypothetical protein